MSIPSPAPSTSVALFRVDRLDASYNGSPVLDGLSFEIRAGERIGLIGPNGAGKSTLIRLLIGLLAPTHGNVIFEGRPLADYRPPELARKIAYLPQESHTPFTLKVWEVVWQGRYPSGGAFVPRTSEDQACLEAALQRADAVAFRHREFNKLSGGERKRVLLARLMAQRASVWMLDEPMANLDLRHQREILKTLSEERAAGTTLVISEHRVDLLARFCDRLILLKAGRILAAGPPEEVATEAHLSDAFEVPIRAFRDSD